MQILQAGRHRAAAGSQARTIEIQSPSLLTLSGVPNKSLFQNGLAFMSRDAHFCKEKEKGAPYCLQVNVYKNPNLQKADIRVVG